MANPVRTDVHVDAPLTNISIAAMNQDESFVAQKAFPRVPVTKESDKYFIFTSSFLFRSKTEVRAAGAPVKLRDYALSTGTYTADEYASGMLVPDRVAENSDAPLRPYEDAATILSHDMMMFIEDNWADVAMVTGAWTSESTLTGTDQWSDYTNSDPIGDIDDAKFTINGLTGIPTNQLSIVMGGAVWNKLKRHPALIAVFGGGFGGMQVLTKQQVAEIFDVKEVLVGEGVWNTNPEGNATQTNARIIGKLCWVGYRPTAPSLMTPAAGYFFSKKVSEIYRWYSSKRRSEVIEICSIFDFKVTMADAGYLYINAVA